MIEVKKNGIVLYAEPVAKIPECAVSLSFPAVLDGCAFSQLMTGRKVCSKGAANPQGTEEACMCYALFLAVKTALCGTPLAAFKNRVNRVVCGISGGQFFINWTTKGNASAVRKTLGIALKALNPARMNSAYSAQIAALCSPNKASFGYVADQIAKGIRSSLHVAIVGGIKIDKEKLDACMDTITSKLSAESPAAEKVKPTGHVECDHENLLEVQASGWHAALLATYIMFKIPGATCRIHNKYVTMPIAPAKFPALAAKLHNGIEDYARNKIEKLGDVAGPVFAYSALADGRLGALDAMPAIKQFNAKSAAAALDKLLK
jgi:hypothetical protein